MQKGGEFGNKFVFLQTNNINLVKNVAGVSASDDDLQIFGGSTGNAASLQAVTLSLGSWQLWFKVQGEWFMVMTDTTMIDRLKEFMECEGRSCSFGPELITPEYVYRMRNGRVALEDIEAAMKKCLPAARLCGGEK